MEPFKDKGLCDIKRLYDEIFSAAEKEGWEQTLRALPFAREKHDGQFRSRKVMPYIWHPLIVTYHALGLGIREDDYLAAALLHDVCEDCGVAPEELPAGMEVQEAVRVLTREPPPKGITEESMILYYEGIRKNRIASIVKLLDRCNNVSSMNEGFSPQKALAYARQTITYVYPVFESAKELNPGYVPQIDVIRYHMDSVLEVILNK